jgi:hypothetical protein
VGPNSGDTVIVIDPVDVRMDFVDDPPVDDHDNDDLPLSQVILVLNKRSWLEIVNIGNTH